MIPEFFYDSTCVITCDVAGDIYVFEGSLSLPDDAHCRETWLIVEEDSGSKTAVRIDDIRLIETP